MVASRQSQVTPSDQARSFSHVPANAEGHFIVCLYDAVLRFLTHVHRLCEISGTEFSHLTDRYPFLNSYLDEIRRELPPDMHWTAAYPWWSGQVAHWERAHPVQRLPLRDMIAEGGIGRQGRTAFMLAGLVEEDSRFGTLLAELQQPLDFRRPTLEFLGQVLGDRGGPIGADAWELCRDLFSCGYVSKPDQSQPRAEWIVRVPAILWDAARGATTGVASHWCSVHDAQCFPPVDELIYAPEFIERIARLPGAVAVPDQLGSLTRAQLLLLRSVPGNDLKELAGSLARTMRRNLLSVHKSSSSAPDVQTLLVPLATLTHAVPFLTSELAPGESVTLPSLAGYRGVVAVAPGMEGGLADDVEHRSITLEVPVPDFAHRRRYWQQATAGRKFPDLDVAAARFHLGGGYIRRAAELASGQVVLEGRSDILIDDVRRAAAALNRQLLDNLATQLDTGSSLSTLICSQSTSDKLDELNRRCRLRERLLGRLGSAFTRNSNRGVRALFTGASGTGKTFAARALASDLGMDLYRVDLASVINKYIGETEKNLHQVLSRAEALDVILLLDEGDSLLGNRTEVRNANDRYANLETNYLLQRLENYQGIVVVTTNLGDNVDSAFQRRMDVVVSFLLPGADERWRILELHLPDKHRVPFETLERVASSCRLSGGQLRNAALHATLLALDDGDQPVSAFHLEAAVASEYRKAGAAYPLAERTGASTHGGVRGFIGALGDG